MSNEQALKTIQNAYEIFIKTTFADIRVHGLEKVAGQPVIFVVNQFTGIEPFIIPAILAEYYQQVPISIVPQEYFKGGYGGYLEKTGSKFSYPGFQNKELTRTLLGGNSAPIIYYPGGRSIPENGLLDILGYCFKNKSLSPETTIFMEPALRGMQTELYRKEFNRRISGKSPESPAELWKELGGLDNFSPDSIGPRQVLIIPLNITYFPAISQIGVYQKIKDLMNEQIINELKKDAQRVEGKRRRHFDVDINIGHPIAILDYLNENKIINEITNKKDYSLESLQTSFSFRKSSYKMFRYYCHKTKELNTINHDQLFAYVLQRYNKKVVDEQDFKNRCYLALEHFKTDVFESKRLPHHSSINSAQWYLLTDDFHIRYDDFVHVGVAENIFEIRNGKIHIRRDTDNIKGKIHFEKLSKDLSVNRIDLHYIRKICRRPAFVIRRYIRKIFLKLDNAIFENDYSQHYIRGETRPRYIGRPYFLRHFFCKRGVLFVHGYLAAPEEMKKMARYFYKKGYTVYGVRMRGHGTSPEDLAGRKWEEWYDSMNRGYIVMKNSVKHLAVVGFSTGSGIALLGGIRKGKHLDGVVSISAPIKLRKVKAKFAPVIFLWNRILSKLNIQRGRLEFLRHKPENPKVNYVRNPIYGVKQLEDLMGIVEKELPSLSQPLLILQASDDPVVDDESAKIIFEKAGSPRKSLIRIESKRHIIVTGRESREVYTQVEKFLREIFRDKNKKSFF